MHETNIAICQHMNKQSVDILMIRVGWALGMRVIVVNAGDSQMGDPIIHYQLYCGGLPVLIVRMHWEGELFVLEHYSNMLESSKK